MSAMLSAPDLDAQQVILSEPLFLTPHGEELDMVGISEERGPESFDQRTAIRCLASRTASTTVFFYVDSGAGQCLSSCSTAFRSLGSCQLEVVGVAGSLPIFGIGTAIFALVLAGGQKFWFGSITVHTASGSSTS